MVDDGDEVVDLFVENVVIAGVAFSVEPVVSVLIESVVLFAVLAVMPCVTKISILRHTG